MLAGLRGLLRKRGSFPPSFFLLLLLTLIAADWRGEALFFSFLFFSTTEISYLIIGLWHLLEPVPLWRENSLCAAQLKPLQFVNLPLPVPGPPGEKAWCAMSDSDSLQPAGQTTGWGRAIPRSLVQQAPKQGTNAAAAFSRRLFDMLTHQRCSRFVPGGSSGHINPFAVQSHGWKVQPEWNFGLPGDFNVKWRKRNVTFG